MKRKDTHTEFWINIVIDSLAGKITDEERNLLSEWIEKSEENRLYYLQIKEIWVSSGMGNPDITSQKEQAFRMFMERVGLSEKNKRIRRKKYFIRAASIAAVLLPFVLLLSLSSRYIELKKSRENQPLVFTSVVAPKGGQSQVELPDGTQVWLNAGSSLRYSNLFAQANRHITLAGEAYFDVATNKEVPFIVDAGELKIEVTGTRFNVKAYETLKQIKVALLQGSVSLHNTEGNETFKLEPMETAIYSKDRHHMDIMKETSSSVNEWMNGDIIFNGEKFDEIVFMLEQRFNVTIHIEKESLKHRQFKGDFTKNETIERIFNIMATDGQFRYKITGDHIDVF